MNVSIIGAGGTASFLLPVLRRTFPTWKVTLIDGDKLEQRNLERQDFSDADIGRYKAEALANMRGCQHLNHFWSGQVLPEDTRLIIVCADNHKARVDAMEYADQNGTPVILCGNEYTSASAMVYLPSFKEFQWKGTRLDPRVRYPDMLTDQSSPLDAGCQGEAQVASPQLAAANHCAANFAVLLAWFWFRERPTIKDKDALPYFPVEHSMGPSRYQTLQINNLT